MNCPQNPSSKKKGRSKRARVLLASVEEATWNLLDKGEKIAKDAAVFKEELHAALGDVRRESEYMANSLGTRGADLTLPGVRVKAGHLWEMCCGVQMSELRVV